MVVHLGQRRDRQLVIGDSAHEQDRRHQQGRGDWAQDEESGEMHAFPFIVLTLTRRAAPSMPCDHWATPAMMGQARNDG